MLIMRMKEISVSDCFVRCSLCQASCGVHESWARIEMGGLGWTVESVGRRTRPTSWHVATLPQTREDAPPDEALYNARISQSAMMSNCSTPYTRVKAVGISPDLACRTNYSPCVSASARTIAPGISPAPSRSERA